MDAIICRFEFECCDVMGFVFEWCNVIGFLTALVESVSSDLAGARCAET